MLPQGRQAAQGLRKRFEKAEFITIVGLIALGGSTKQLDMLKAMYRHYIQGSS